MHLLIAPRIFFHFDTLIFDYFFKYESIETHAHTFFALIILGIATVAKEIVQ
jgi:hypothetical protein